jgi:hypothetical protein
MSIRILSICISFLCACSACASLFLFFLMLILYTISICIRNWCVHWAYASGTNVCTEGTIKFVKAPTRHAEHMRQELMRTLSVCIRNWCYCWADASGTEAYPWAYASVSYSYARYKCNNSNFFLKFLQTMLSIWVRNWCMHWECASGTDACAERTR